MFAKSYLEFCLIAGAAILTIGTCGSLSAAAAATEQQSAPVAREIGTIKAINGSIITLTTGAGADIEVLVEDTTRILCVEPGSKDLKSATPLPFKDLQTGDRVIVSGQPPADAKPFTAIRIVAMKHEDIEAKRQHEREEWQRHGIGGLVKSADSAAGSVVLGVGGLATAENVVVHITKDTIVRRYAPDSVQFDDAKPGNAASIHPGDQLRARGTRSADGKDFAADEIVTGAFRNIAGTITSVDAAANAISVLDAITKQPVVVKIPAESQIRKLPPEAAQRIAMRLKAAASGNAGMPGANASAAGPSQARPAAGSPGATAGGGRMGGGPDLEQLLSRMAPATLADLKKDDAVMIVSTEGGTLGQVTAITVVAGVEPILTASPRGAQAMTLSPWALGGGAESIAGADANP
jgi:hypothetical protein